MATNTPMLEVRDLHVYYGKNHILYGVDMHIDEGEIAALLGCNGVGRSTLAKSIMGMVRHEGEILLRGKSVSDLRTLEVAHKGIGYVPENRDISPTLTVWQNLLLGGKRNPGQPKPHWQVEDIYQMFPRLKERENTVVGALSGGGQQMLTLYRTLMNDLDFIIIDGPTEDFTLLVVTLVDEYLRTLKERGISVLLVEQKLVIALDTSQRVYVVGHGQTAFEETPQQLEADAKVRQEWLKA